MVRDLSNQPDRLADYSSYDDKSRIESADTGSYDDKSRIESAEELEEINTIEKQKVKEFELLEVSDKDAELVHEEGYDETINSNENIVAENNELIVEILLQEKTLTDNNIENERTNLECDKKTIVEQDKVDKIIEKSLQDNCNVEIDAKYRKQDTNSEDTDKSQCSTETDKSFVKDRTEDSNRMFHENVPFYNLHNNTTESVIEDNLYEDPIAGDHIENLDENREETINGTEEEVVEKDDQNEDSSESYTVINGQSFHPEDVNIGVYDENQKEKFVAQDMSESFHNLCPIQVEPKVNERTRLEELKEIMDDWINYNFNKHESEEECWFA